MSDNPHKTSLDAILAVTRERVSALAPRATALERAARSGPPIRPFPGLAQATVGVIAEVKRRSPSQGAIREDLDPVSHAAAYARAGAVAVSVLTDGPHFGGSIEDLERVVAAVPVPVLRKDFVIDETQIHEARAAGASAVLLIARIVSATRLELLARLVRSCGMTPLIEVHKPAELDAALAAGPSVLGINARDLDTFAVDLAGAETLIRRIPAGVPVVAESGIETRADVERLAAAGADFVLVGTSVARAPDPEQAVRALVGVKRHSGARA
ncbi:MAG: indole-3-glycerol-phosphate synthase TrpC [Gemmatimonadetes bacterium]|nr:MAG: indole-3-glycerol-phosphate synthase TrpC [Gemmatimonadota bacterium]